MAFRMLAVPLLALLLPFPAFAQEASWHGIKYSPDKVIEKLRAHEKLQMFQQTADWNSLDSQSKLKQIATFLNGTAPPAFLGATNDLIDLSLSSLYPSDQPDRLAECIHLSILPQPNDSDFSLDVYYALLSEFKNTTYSLTIYKTLVAAVDKSESSAEIARFLSSFPNSIDAQPMLFTFYRVIDKEAQASMLSGDAPAAIGLYGKFIDDHPESDLALIALERLDAAMFDAIITTIRDSTKTWNGLAIRTKDRLEICESYIRQFPFGKGRVDIVARVMQELESADWEEKRKLIDATDPLAKAKINSLINEVGLEASFHYGKADEEGGNLSEKLIHSYHARRDVEYLRYLTQSLVLKEQFEAQNIEAYEAALQSIQAALTLTEIQKVNLKLSDIHKTLQEQLATLNLIVKDLEAVNTSLQGISMDIQNGFEGLSAQLNAVNSNLVTLNDTAKSTQQELRKGFAEVNASLQTINGSLTEIKQELGESNAKLDKLHESMEATNNSVKELRDSVNKGFEGLKKTIKDVAKKDVSNMAFWKTKGTQASDYLKERRDAAKKTVKRWLGMLQCEVEGLVNLPPPIGPEPIVHSPLPSGVKEEYMARKVDVLTRFTDTFGAVCNIKKAEDPSNNEFINQGDSAWRTSHLLICLAIERDDANCQKVLGVLGQCWSGDHPIRHPDLATADSDSSTPYSRDQFWPHLAALFYCHRFGNDQTQKMARDLMERFVDTLAKHQWRLSSGDSAHFNANSMSGRYVVMLVSRKMGFERLWKDDLDAAAYAFYRGLWRDLLDARAFQIGVLPGFDDETGDVDATRANEFSAVNNLFWQVLLVYDCGDADERVKRIVCRMAHACEPHEMGLFLWLGGKEAGPRDWLSSWPENWHGRDYVWQRSRFENRKPKDPSEDYPRLDYMVLAKVFELTHINR